MTNVTPMPFMAPAQAARLTKIDDLKYRLDGLMDFDRFVQEVGREPMPNRIASAQRAADRRGMLLETYLRSKRLHEIKKLQRQIARLEKQPA